MVYFGFDDAVNSLINEYYDEIFTNNRNNPNGCPITMSLYVSDLYTDYKLVKKYYDAGHEIGVHGVNDKRIDTAAHLSEEAKQQRDNLIKHAEVKTDDIVGWRSPFLTSAGEEQPRILNNLGFKYDITVTYDGSPPNDIIWPSTLDYPWPYTCFLNCPRKTVKGFWLVPVIPLQGKNNNYKCTYVDGCLHQPNNETEAFDYLWNNFNAYYTSSRAPFGLSMHAAWFAYSPYKVSAVNKFLEKILALKDVYVVSVKQVLEWMEKPTPLSKLKDFKP
ncbi:chitin deacetylase 7-like [Octopus vulgaris]|uniref:Chitin deacetylase 7-like n=1 Tax=Octopus vulgaris TaxID=6645 RepID=A0AA36EZG5_OCTVU|nr:chitin deacetylase 7-like [Octopus vulgaris]